MDQSKAVCACVCEWVARQNTKEEGRNSWIKERHKKGRCKDKGGGGVEGHRGGEGEDEGLGGFRFLLGLTQLGEMG